ncbi:hypothetical protein GQF61_05760 [Sphingobacterium sp. DK4209]|uniref:Glycoside hydrolase family 42 N-terminal domain-containing protein n=1 Tax=Sphingobacterium zhuxiongii TaxID=2662364 RepID=A0A5Q0QF73_9SPHI|nr:MULTISPECIES: hypothetical protein [unclassified Sphingobacterium]MVZ65353.1 hypothetical protein [Sphingobacterium sp. DK4209]QGA26438.1 hypothetical protein GFH32_08900 [Sphingobacterium sp. dk4302]
MRKALLILINISCCLLGSVYAQQKQQTLSSSPDKFAIGVFWPPVWEFSNEEQYKWIGEANIDFVENVKNAKMFSEEHNMHLLALAAKYGFKVTVADPRIFGTDAEIAEAVATYKNHKALEGYYIKDEPDSTEFPWASTIYKKLIALDPVHVPHVNLFPNFVIPSYETNHVERWVNLVGADKLKYLTFDQYPFMANGRIRPTYYENLDIIRRVGLKYKVRTAAYLQSVGIIDAYKRPSESELRFNIYSALAYGIKRPVWFTYWTPTNAGKEIFTDAIIDPYGRKTDLYEPFQKLNKEVKQISEILFNSEALEVYHVGADSAIAIQSLPVDFVIQPTSNADDLIITKFLHKNGDQYIMMVNKSLTVAKTLSFKILDSGVKQLTSLTVKDQSLKKEGLSIDKQRTFSLNLLPGEGRMLLLGR